MKILKIKNIGKWSELWIEGLPFEYETYFDQDLMVELPMFSQKKYNYSCKTGYLYQIAPDNDIQSLVGKRVRFDDYDHIHLDNTYCLPCKFEFKK